MPDRTSSSTLNPLLIGFLIWCRLGTHFSKYVPLLPPLAPFHNLTSIIAPIAPCPALFGSAAHPPLSIADHWVWSLSVPASALLAEECGTGNFQRSGYFYYHPRPGAQISARGASRGVLEAEIPQRELPIHARPFLALRNAPRIRFSSPRHHVGPH